MSGQPLSYCVATHPGVRRVDNEDSCCVRPDLGLFVVADGVGGYAAGEVASRAAVAAIEGAVSETAGWTEDSPWPFDYQPELGVDGNRLNWAFHLANTQIRCEAQAGRGRQGMATTVAAVLFECGADARRQRACGATIGHVGDSRIYRYRQGKLDRLTRDHSWVEEQVRAGAISSRDARQHPRRNLLTRALTGAVDPVADLGWVPTAPGDRLLLCSDGLFGVLSDEQIVEILGKYEGAADEVAEDGDRTPTDARASDATVTDATVGDATVRDGAERCGGHRDAVCDALVHAANLGGGPDNITVILVRL